MRLFYNLQRLQISFNEQNKLFLQVFSLLLKKSSINLSLRLKPTPLDMKTIPTTIFFVLTFLRQILSINILFSDSIYYSRKHYNLQSKYMSFQFLIQLRKEKDISKYLKKILYVNQKITLILVIINSNYLKEAV